MKIHNLEFVGKFIIQFVYHHDIWTHDDVGSVIYNVDEQQFYVGGYDDWILVNLHTQVIRTGTLNLGYEIQQLSADDFPASYDSTTQTTIQGSIDSSLYEIENYDWKNLSSRRFDITANGFNVFGQPISVDDMLSRRTRDDVDGLILNDSTSFINPILIQDALLYIEYGSTLPSSTSATIPSFNSTSFIQLDLDEIYSDVPIPPNLNQLLDYIEGPSCDSTSVVFKFLQSNRNDYGLNCIDASQLKFTDATLDIIPTNIVNFQHVLDSCGEDFTFDCHDHIITDILIFDHWDDYTAIRDHYEYDHVRSDPNIMYDLMNMQVLRYYNGLWPTIFHRDISELLGKHNALYVVPITNTMFYINCDGEVVKIFDKARYGS